MEIPQQGSHRHRRQGLCRAVVDVKMLHQKVLHILYRRLNIRKEAACHPEGDKLLQLLTAGQLPQHQKLRHHDAVQLIIQPLLAVSPLVDAVKTLAGGNIRPCQHQLALLFIHQGDIIILGRFQHAFLQDGAGGDYLHHLTLGQPLGLGVTNLLGNGHPVALGHQLAQIAVHGMIRDAAHGIFCHIPAAAGQSKPQFLGHNLRILKEHLIKIPQAKKQNLLGMSLFDFHILLLHRGKFH